MAIATRRGSKYVDAVRRELYHRQHLTNAELVSRLRMQFPEISATTIHRITQRLLRDGECQNAPINMNGEMRFDSNVMPHDHFECVHCGSLRDIIIPASAKVHIERSLGDCRLGSMLMIHGSCAGCVRSTDDMKAVY